MIFLTIIIIYTIVIGHFIVGFKKLKTTSEIINIPPSQKPLTHFSIIIPLRNEAGRLPGLLDSLSKLNYPKDCFEVLLINDESTDESLEIIENFRSKNSNITISVYENERLSAAPKKDAITLAIKKAKYEWVINTDADCLVPVAWLNCYHDFIIKKNVDFIAGPVIYKTSNSFIDNYQLLDMLSLQGVTMGSFGHQKGLFCNGANLAYTKTLFKAVNGFKNNNTIASGDDVFMLANVQAQSPEKVGYIKSRLAVVTTFPETNWKNLIKQRIRWAKKTSKQKAVSLKLIGIIVFITNLSVLVFPLSFIFFPSLFWFGALAMLLKLLVDIIIIKKTAGFFGKHISATKIFVHFYSYALISVWVVTNSPFLGYTWKGRAHRY